MCRWRSSRPRRRSRSARWRRPWQTSPCHQPDRKITSRKWARGSRPGLGAVIGPGQGRYESGGLGRDGDGVAEQRLDLPDVVLDLPVLVGAGLVVAGAEVGEPGGGVGEQVPDDHQDGPGDGDLGLGLAAAAGDPPVALAEERVGAGGADGGLAELPRSQVLPWPFFPARVRGPDWRADGHSPAHETRWAAVGNRDISRPVSAMMARARSGLMPGIS